MFVIEGTQQTDPPVVLALREDSDGINLVVLDTDGEIISHVLAVTSAGAIELFLGPMTQSRTTEFQRSKAGYVKIVRR